MRSLNKDSDRVRVLMFGPHLNATSGISNVVNNWLEAGIKEKIELHYISTLKKFVPGRYVHKLTEAAVAYAILAVKTWRTVDICHIHMSSDMSFFRKWPIFEWAKLMKIKTIVHVHGSTIEEFCSQSNQKVKNMIIRAFQ